VSDFDRDDDPGVAVTNQESNNVRIFENDGSGDLSEIDTVQTGAGSNPTGIDAGKFDGDRDTDLAVVGEGAIRSAQANHSEDRGQFTPVLPP
jgi:hypothetical protein